MTIHFPDLSHHKQVPLDGAVALITKATQGTGYIDYTYARYRDDAHARGIPFAGFHWVDISDLASQAANAFRVMGATPCMWDAEAAGVTVPRLVELTKRYRAIGGNPRLVYLPHWWWRDHLGSPDLTPLADLGLALVSSAYPAGGYTGDNGIGWTPYGGVAPQIWQWSDAHQFNGQLVDFNAYKGTVEQLWALFTGTTGGGGSLVGVEEWAATAGPHTWALTQGNPGYVGQQRDTALAFAWEAAHEAMVASKAALAKCDEILAALKAGGGGGLTMDQAEEAAFRGAQRAERE